MKIARSESLEREVSLPSQRLDAFDQVLGVAFGGEDLEELGKVDLQPLDLFPELGELALGLASLLDLLLQPRKLRALGADLVIQAPKPRVVHGRGQGDAEDEADGQRDAPFAFFDPEFECDARPKPSFPSSREPAAWAR